MSHSALTSLALGLLLVTGLPSDPGGALPGGGTRGREDALDARGRRFVDLLNIGDARGAAAGFDETMTRLLPAEKLAAAWKSVQGQLGALQAITGVEVVPGSDHDTVVVSCRLERASLQVKLGYDKAGRVAALYFLPVTDGAAGWKAPAYADPKLFREEETDVDAGGWPLPATLTMPMACDPPVPGLVLVHGSGPNDRDETIGPNKPFKDLAWGLASRGIAVLRYEKRTKEHGRRILDIAETFTLNDETVTDAVAAAALLRRTPGVDPRRVVVLGHSLGGMAAPRIGAADPQLAGLVIMAGTTRHLEDIMLEQFRHIYGLDGEITPDEQEKLDAVAEDVAAVKALTEADTKATDRIIFGAWPRYWLDLRDYEPPTAARDLPCPMLVLQGGRDYQVTTVDFDRWKAALSSRADVTFKFYPPLNHLFFEGTGPCAPAEYGRHRSVEPYVVEDMASWLRALPPR